MTTLWQSISVPYSFPVIFGRRTFASRNPVLVKAIARLEPHRRHRVMVCIDRGVHEAYPELRSSIQGMFMANRDRLELAGAIEILTGGEHAKVGLAGIRTLIGMMAARGMDRQSVVLVIGGGGLLDRVGLAASLVHRGLRLVRMPTTVAAQNDVGVGVKTGVDMGNSKNFLGTFAPPFAVINDFDFLDRLPDREWVAGIAEAFKVAMITNRRFFTYLCRDAKALRRRDRRAMEYLVKECARLHLNHIRRGGDPFETGSARPLDFGHWSAHELEGMSGYRLRHGEAVAIGIALDSYYAMTAGHISRAALDDLLKGLHESGLPIWHKLLEKRTSRGTLAVLAGLTRFREHLGGELTLTLPSPVGKRIEIHDLDPSVVEAGIAFLKGHTAP